MEFVSTTTEGGVTERRFDLKVGDESVPGIVWTPEGASGNRPLVLIGHGGTQHKRVENVLRLACSLVRNRGYAAVAIDAPGHGDRGSAEAMARLREQILSKQFTPEQRRQMESRHGLGVVEWKATLDAMEQLPEIGQGAVGYWGLSMGTFIGAPFIAAEPRVKCAVLGLAGLRPGADALERAARSVTIPLLFLFQLNDELMTPESGLALFSAFGSSIKSMHLNPGPHVGVPPYEREYYETFFVRHLGQARDHTTLS
jgi:dienelactone hydrolase